MQDAASALFAASPVRSLEEAAYDDEDSERGVQEPSMEQLRRICQILKLDPRYLLDLEAFEGITAEDIKLLRQMQNLIDGYKK